ncbi:uncharacterized protein LOC141628850 [Silene latifolia]|uniref:uncharacterized protein LOC141628850 n=1 Tax=Silene latifolia TaxID=37657 RepID=UPI003D76D30E
MTIGEGQMFKPDDDSESESESESESDISPKAKSRVLGVKDSPSPVFPIPVPSPSAVIPGPVPNTAPISPLTSDQLAQMLMQFRSATYQRIATTLLHDMIHKEVEVYIDDMIIKWKERNNHLMALRKFFERLRKMDPIKYLFEKPVLNGRMSRWTLMLFEFDLKYVPLKAIKGKVVADFLADNPVEETDIVDTWSFPDEDIVHGEDDVWDLYFDGASNSMGCGIGVLIISPRGEHVSVSIKLDFAVTNNAAEYEACLLGLQSANKLGVMKLTVHGDSSLVINQVTGSWKIKSSSLAPYQAKIEELEKLFEEWVEAKSYKVLNAKQVAKFIQNDIICWYGVPHEFISDHGTHFQAETAVILEKYRIKHHKSSPYRPQTNGAVEAANKTVDTILRKMSDNYKEWPEKIPFALWGYRTSIRTATGANPYYLVYGMEAVQPVELEVPSLRILLESQVPEADWVQARYDSLVLLDERRLNALYHVQLYQKRIERGFNKKVKPRGINEGDLVHKSVRALLPVDPRGKFKPNWAGPYLVKKILTGGAVRLTDLDGNDFSNPTNMDQLKKYYP